MPYRYPYVASILIALLGCSETAKDAAAHTKVAPPDPEQHAAHADHDDHAAHADHGDHGPALAAAAPLPGASLYQLDSTWRDQANQPFALASLRGNPTVFLMFYGTCKSVCPALIGDVLRTDAALPAAEQARVHYALVTFDPTTDTPARLAELAKEHGLDSKRFHLLHGDDDSIRELATVLGIQYRATGGGHFAHTAALSLVDADGVFRKQTEGVSQPVEPITEEIAALLRTSKTATHQ